MTAWKIATPETWRPVPGYPMFEASDNGRVRRQRGNAKCHTGPQGYRRIWCQEAGTSYGAHRLVALAFHGEPVDPTAVVRHLDGVRDNNVPSNLAWGTVAENSQDMVRHGHHYNKNKAACPQGHRYTPENTTTDSLGRRRCRRCGYERQVTSRSRGLPTDDSRHGTRSGYTMHGCRCEPCVNAERVYQTARRRNRKGLADAPRRAA